VGCEYRRRLADGVSALISRQLRVCDAEVMTRSSLGRVHAGRAEPLPLASRTSATDGATLEVSKVRIGEGISRSGIAISYQTTPALSNHFFSLLSAAQDGGQARCNDCAVISFLLHKQTMLYVVLKAMFLIRAN
jgi:hypothetical protein